MKLKIALIGLLWTLTSGFLYAQISLSGRILDFHDRTPLVGAQIQLGNYKTQSDKNGNYQIKKIKPGNYHLQITHPLCDAVTRDLYLDKDTMLNIELEHHAQDIEAVTLHGSLKKTNSVIIKTLDKSTLERNATENLGNLLTNISGVSVLKTGNNIAKPIIHGLYGTRISILNNGIKLEEQDWGVEHAPNVDPASFQHIDVVKGASALKYGSDAIGGVILLEPEIFPKKDSIMGSINLAGISNGRGVSTDVSFAQIWKSGWAVKTSGGYKKLGDLSAPDYHLKNTGMEFSSFNFGLQNRNFKKGVSFDYAFTKQNLGILRDSHVSSFKDYERAMTTPIPVYSGPFSYDLENPRQEVEHHLAKFSAYKRTEDFGKLSATYSFQYNHRQEYDLRRGDLNQIPSLDLALMTHQFNFNDLLERGKWSLESGLDAGFQNNYSNPATQTRRLIPNYDKYNLGAYSVLKIKWMKGLSTEAGLRYDHQFYDVTKWYDAKDWEQNYAKEFSEFYVKTKANRILTRPKLYYNNLSAVVGIEFKPTQDFNLKLNYAKVSRTPNIAELFSDGLHHSAAIIEKGNMRMQNETGNQLNLNVDANFNVLEGLHISVNPYVFLTKNFINQIPNGVLQPTQAGTFPVWIYQQVDAEMYGVDVDVLFKLHKNFNYQGRVSYVHGQDKTHEVPLILMMPPNFSNALEISDIGKSKMYFRVENVTFLQQNRFPNYNITYQDYVGGELVDKTLDISTPPPGYSLWNLQTGLNLNKHFSAGVVINNVFNLKYKDYLNRLRFFADEAGRSIIVNFKYQF